MELTVINSGDSAQGKSYYEVHKPGCRHLQRGWRTMVGHWPVSGTTEQEVLDNGCDPELEDMGYTQEDFRVMPCAKAVLKD